MANKKFEVSEEEQTMLNGLMINLCAHYGYDCDNCPITNIHSDCTLAQFITRLEKISNYKTFNTLAIEKKEMGG